jgi:hypothetical protein
MPQRLLGIALITGGTLVGIIIMALMASYVRSGHFTAATATFGVIIALLLGVLPQFGLGAYLIWHSLGDETNSKQEEI